MGGEGSFCAKIGTFPFSKIIINLGANLNLQNSEGNTPLHESVLRGHGAIVSLLLSRGANPYIDNHAGKTPVELAPPTMASKFEKYKGASSPVVCSAGAIGDFETCSSFVIGLTKDNLVKTHQDIVKISNGHFGLTDILINTRNISVFKVSMEKPHFYSLLLLTSLRWHIIF